MTTSAAIVLVAAMIFAVPLLAIWTRRPRQHRDDGRRNQVIDALESEVLALRDRVETLETIVTDSRYVLESEFDELEADDARMRRRDRVNA